MSRLPHLALLLVLAFVAMSLSACQGLAQALGVQPSANAPVIEQHFSQVANRGSGRIDDTDSRSDQEANGDVGASGSGTAALTASQTTTIDPEAIARGAAEILKTATPGGQAATLADAALAEVANGDAKAAARLLKRAKAAEGTESPTETETQPPAAADTASRSGN